MGIESEHKDGKDDEPGIAHGRRQNLRLAGVVGGPAFSEMKEMTVPSYRFPTEKSPKKYEQAPHYRARQFVAFNSDGQNRQSAGGIAVTTSSSSIENCGHRHRCRFG